MTAPGYCSTSAARFQTEAACILLSILLLSSGCSAPDVYLTPETIRASCATDVEKIRSLRLWRRAVEIGNEFLSSSFNETLPSSAQLELIDEGLHLVTSDQVKRVQVLLVDDFPSSSCVCAHVNTRDDVVLAFRPWRTDESLPLETNNDFLSPLLKALDEPEPNLTLWMLYVSSALYFHDEAHIGSWEWFKCQRLEWLLGSGHHRKSMELPSSVLGDFWNYYYESN